MNSIIFDDGIVLYWDLPDKYEPGDIYSLFINGKKTKESVKTHFWVKNLKPLTDYSIRVEWNDKNGTLKGIPVDEIYKTRPEKKTSECKKQPL